MNALVVSCHSPGISAPRARLGRHFLLSEGDAPGRVRFLGGKVELAEGVKQSWITLTRAGRFYDQRYGWFDITPRMLAEMVANFDARTYGQDVFIDVAHKPNDGAAAKVLRLTVEGSKLRALVDWTAFGVDAVRGRGFAYLSAEFDEQWKDNEQGDAHGCVLLGAGLTTRPVIKHLDPVQLSAAEGDDDTRLVYAQSDVDINTHEGWLLDSMQQVIDENYSRQVSRDTKRSMMSAAADGFWMGGRVPYGFRAVPAADGRRRRMAPDEYESAVARQMFGWAADGVGALLIATRLNELGVTLNGRPWRKAAVLYLLKSEAYMGMVIFNRFDRKTRKEKPAGEWVRVQAHEAIVAPDLFEGPGGHGRAGTEARAELRHQPACVHRPAALRALRRRAEDPHGQGPRRRHVQLLRCHNHLQGVRCGLPAFRADQFDAWMPQQLLDNVLTVDVIQGVLDRLDDAASDWVKDRARRRTALLLELRAAEGRRRRLFEVIEEGGKGAPGLKDLGPRLRELNDQIESLERAMVALEAEPEPTVGPLTVTAEEAAEIFRNTITMCEDPKKRRAVLATITDRIVINDGSVDVHYKPDCLVRADGQPVRSEHCWLPDLGSNQGPTD